MMRVGVIIPARDEQALLPACLESVRRAAERVPIPVTLVVAADRCRDRTVDIARELGAVVVSLDAGAVGAARAAAADAASEAGSDWLACTDADSVVPPHWLLRQLALADAGWDAVVGTVRPRPADLAPRQARAWALLNGAAEAAGGIHGANLGIREAAYRAVGGFAPLAEHEDVDLVERLRLVARVTATADAEVMTSGRRWGRTTGGFARYLRDDLIPLAEGAARP